MSHLCLTVLLLRQIDANAAFPVPLGFVEGDYDFPETETERSNNWSLAKRCGKAAISGSSNDQRNDPSCPNVLLINTDDMAWADISINNPSKLIPTPNIDRLVSKGINFRDGHSCTSRCAPSRYCLMTGRYHFRRGDYHYKPMELEYGRKVLSHLFKRNNYKTLLVGKPQPVETNMQWNNHVNQKEASDYYFVEGTRFWAYDRSLTSRSYCCLPGGGYFVNDTAAQLFDKYATFYKFRNEVPGMDGAINIAPEVEEEFYSRPENWHLLDGYTVDGNPESARRHTTYMAYWNAIKNNIKSGLNQRRRRSAEGHIHKRDTKSNKNRKSVIQETISPNKKLPKESYVRFQHRKTDAVVIANFKVKSGGQERFHYEFGNGKYFDTLAEAEASRQEDLVQYLKIPGNTEFDVLYRDMKGTRPKKTQVGFESTEIMEHFKTAANQYIEDHVNWSNPKKPAGTSKSGDENKPFFMYLSFRAPHRPFSHNKTFDPNDPEDHLPYRSLGKPTEQIGIFDKAIGQVMKNLQDLDIADNTLIFFTSDNGPDQGMFHTYSRWGHINIGMMRGKKASVYEGGHRVPFLSWWPLGTHKALQGTNFDLPVSQIDFFATFADILNYPLPSKEKCVYSYDSNTAAVHNQDATRLGRPTDFTGSRTWNNNMRKWLTGDISWVTGYSAEVILRGGRKNEALYLREVQLAGFTNVEKWLTKEEFTGFVIGWDGCMAEDSTSFADAYKAKKTGEYEKDGKTVHKFENVMQKVPSKIFAGKLGDVSLRLGRYKFVRYNPPKDKRTGPNRQHLVTHTKDEGNAWLKASWEDRCIYDEDGNSLNPGCQIEPMCRNFTTFGETACMRDHFYQLWDLEKNFGEKVFCNSEVRTNKTPNKDLQDVLFKNDRSNIGDGTKASEKPADKFGYGSGMESTPIGEWINDCCVLNYDEDTVVENLNSCENRKIIKHGKETHGGICKKNSKVLSKGADFESFIAWGNRHKAWIMGRKNFDELFGYTDAYFKNFPETAEDFAPGYACTNIAVAFPDKSLVKQTENYIFDNDLGDWRHTTFADRLCVPEIKSEFNLGCKVPDHNGPLGEGWEGNSQWENSKTENRRENDSENGKISEEDFGKWTEFSNCMKDVLNLLEGQAYQPETTEDIRIYGQTPMVYVDTNQKPLVDDKQNGTYLEDEKILAGGMIGQSNYARNNAKEMWSRVKRPNDNSDKFFHGAGSRYVEENGVSLAERCQRFLPSGAPDPYDIKPNYDLEMDLVGWYDSGDKSGGQLKELTVNSIDENGNVEYNDERKRHKYYTKNNGNWLFAFTPEYV